MAHILHSKKSLTQRILGKRASKKEKVCFHYLLFPNIASADTHLAFHSECNHYYSKKIEIQGKLSVK